MRILQLTPGTGHFYCGSCLRDNALAKALRALRHEVEVVPLYLPLVLEEESTDAHATVRMGGVDLYLQHRSALYRRVPRRLTRWLDHPALLRFSARRGDMTDAQRLGAITVSTLEGDEGPIARAVEELTTSLLPASEDARPDVVMLSNAMLIGVARRLRQALDRPVVCTLQGEAPFLDALVEPHRTRAWEVLRDRARHVDAFLAVSHDYGARLSPRLGLGPDRVHVVHNGIDVHDLAPAAAPPAAPAIGFLARMCREKGLPTLVEAFTRLVDGGEFEGLRLRVAGVQLHEDLALVRELQRRLRAHGSLDRVEFLPNLARPDKVRFLQSLSVLSVPATYGESFGLYVLEALACGVPVVQPRHGAFPEVLDATGGGVLCEPDDPGDLARAIATLLRAPDAARSMGATGRERVLARFTSAHMAKRVETVLHGL